MYLTFLTSAVEQLSTLKVMGGVVKGIKNDFPNYERYKSLILLHTQKFICSEVDIKIYKIEINGEKSYLLECYQLSSPACKFTCMFHTQKSKAPTQILIENFSFQTEKALSNRGSSSDEIEAIKRKYGYGMFTCCIYEESFPHCVRFSLHEMISNVEWSHSLEDTNIYSVVDRTIMKLFILSLYDVIVTDILYENCNDEESSPNDKNQNEQLDAKNQRKTKFITYDKMKSNSNGK